jgi:putative transposase
MRLAAKARQLTRELLEQTTVLFTPETILSWYRRLIAQKYDGSPNCKHPGRPKISQKIIDLVILSQRHTDFQSVRVSRKSLRLNGLCVLNRDV